MIQGFDATTAPVVHEPLDAERARSAGVSTAISPLVNAVGLEAGVWEHSVGSSTDSFGGEMFVVLSGRGSVTCQHGGRIDLAPGVLGVLHDDDVTSWEITEPLRKVWIVAAAAAE
jgi:uncharacterized cupin superfamily protein